MYNFSPVFNVILTVHSNRLGKWQYTFTEGDKEKKVKLEVVMALR